MIRHAFRNENTVGWGKVAVFSLLFVVNCLACQNTTVGIIVTLAEATYVIILSLIGDTESAILANNIFMGVSIEASLFVYSEFTYMYSYAYMPVVHRWGCLGCELFILLCTIIKHGGRFTLGTRSEIKKQWSTKFVLSFVLLIFAGFASSLLSIITNDNQINTAYWFWGAYETEACYWLHTAAANGRWCGANGHDAVSAVGLKMAI